ncbi:hypothetical protein SD77_2771 [Bacillus badius]|uniref:Uncharacterized protein n=1 Tax=Bacillus badius TaxID=1455 RepID=A0ABR5APR2_BACBA|nr:hypothetical protein SD77_2771 [Bacillus badius]
MEQKIIFDLATTLNGFIERKKHEVDWCIMDFCSSATSFSFIGFV